MGTKNKSAGSQHTPRGVTQGVSLVAPNGLPIDYVIDGTGKIRLAVDANVIINNATVNIDIDSTTDNIAIRNTNNSNELLINGDGSINTNVAVSAIDGDTIAISDGTNTLVVNGDGSLNAVITTTDLDIRDLTHISDSIKIGDGTEFLAINPDGSINVGNIINVQSTNLDIRDLTHTSDSIKIGDGSDILLINPDGSINIGNFPAVQDVNIISSIPGTIIDASSDDLGDGLITLSSGPDVISSISVPLGSTYNIFGWDWYSDRVCTFRLEIRDGVSLVRVIRATLNSGSVPGSNSLFLAPIPIIGASGRVVRVTATRISGASGVASGGINGYMV